jgi:hypothetical protein
MRRVQRTNLQRMLRSDARMCRRDFIYRVWFGRRSMPTMFRQHRDVQRRRMCRVLRAELSERLLLRRGLFAVEAESVRNRRSGVRRLLGDESDVQCVGNMRALRRDDVSEWLLLERGIVHSGLPARRKRLSAVRASRRCVRQLFCATTVLQHTDGPMRGLQRDDVRGRLLRRQPLRPGRHFAEPSLATLRWRRRCLHDLSGKSDLQFHDRGLRGLQHPELSERLLYRRHVLSGECERDVRNAR